MIKNRAVREILKIFKVHLMVDWCLRIFPRKGQFGRYQYPVTSLEAWLVEKEIFKEGIYDGVFDLSGVETFADLGCNRGFFSVWLAEKVGARPKGILVEANPALISCVEELLIVNGFAEMSVLHGAVGAGITDGMVEFLVPPTDVGAGLQSTTSKVLANDACNLVRVPILRMGEAWSKRFPNGERCGILKIDIEGAEGRFFCDEKDFLGIVERVVVEVHESTVSVDAIERGLKENGFLMKKSSKEDSETTLLFAERTYG